MITVAVHANISREDRDNDRRMVSELYALKAGTKVVLYVGKRDIVDFETVRLVHEYVDRLHFEVQGSWAAANAWSRAIARPNQWAGI